MLFIHLPLSDQDPGRDVSHAHVYYSQSCSIVKAQVVVGVEWSLSFVLFAQLNFIVCWTLIFLLQEEPSGSLNLFPIAAKLLPVVRL